MIIKIIKMIIIVVITVIFSWCRWYRNVCICLKQLSIEPILFSCLPSLPFTTIAYNYLSGPDSSRPCFENQFRCSTGECIDHSRLCDGFDDCEEGQDEKFCSSTYNSPSTPVLVPETTGSAPFSSSLSFTLIFFSSLFFADALVTTPPGASLVSCSYSLSMFFPFSLLRHFSVDL